MSIENICKRFQNKTYVINKDVGWSEYISEIIIRKNTRYNGCNITI